MKKKAEVTATASQDSPPESSPDRLYIGKDDKKKYDKLRENAFAHASENLRQDKQLFMLALAYGVYYGRRETLEGKQGFFLTDRLKDADEQLLKSVAVAAEGEKILMRHSDVYSIAEQYAHGGLDLLLSDAMNSSLGTFETKLEKDLTDIFEKESAVEKPAG